MSEVKVNKISPRTNCGTTQLGDSGDTFTLPSGGTLTIACGATITNNGTQSGFGREGTVNWDTTAKTANFTAVSGNGYFVNTTSGAITVTLPASPSAGDIVSLSDYTNTWQTNNVTVGRNSQPIGGIAADALLSTEGQSVTFVYVDGTEGWKNVQDSTSNITGNPYIQATGGTITTCGNYKIHTFTSPGTFCVSVNAQCASYQKVDYMVIAGGGGGGYHYGAGGGAGGYRESKCATVSGCYTASPLATPTSMPVSVTGYPITVGAGGAGSPTSPPYAAPQGCNGSNSVFSTITSAGGGGGAGTDNGVRNGSPGGSGGGAGGSSPGGTGGTGNTPPVSPPQGQNGGGGTNQYGGGSGGGAGGAGANKQAGAGTSSAITGSATFRAGGGNGGPPSGQNTCSGRTAYGATGAANSGSGGGGDTSGGGGSGIVVIRYRYQ